MKQKHFLLIAVFSVLALALEAQNGGSDSISTTSYNVTSYDAPQQRLSILPTTRGNFMIGTGIGFSTSNSEVSVNSQAGNFSGDGGSSSQLNFSPSLGYFFANNFAFGVGMELIASRTSSQTDITDPNSPKQSSENSNVLFGPFARLYLSVSDDKAFFLSSTLGFGSSRDQYSGSTGNSQNINNTIVTVGVGPGFTVFTRSGLALESGIRYNYARSKSDINIDTVTRESTTRTHAFDFSVGLRYYFGGFRRIDPSQPQTGRF